MIEEIKKQMDSDYNHQFAYSGNYMGLTKYWVATLAVKYQHEQVDFAQLNELLLYNRKKYEEYAYVNA